MKTIKRVLALMLALCLCAGMIAGCGKRAADSGKLKIVVTVFPIYDWMRNILGDRVNDVELILLEQSGADLHNFQPTVQDIYAITTCDLFVCIGGESDKWVANALAQGSKDGRTVINLLQALGTSARAEETPEGAVEAEEEHDGPAYDEHIWLSLRNAAALCPVMAEALAAHDKENAETYRKNCEAYVAQLKALDGEYAAATQAAATKTLLFADRYPFLYLVQDYGLTAYAAFSGCSTDVNASFEMIHNLSEKIRTLELKHVAVLESSDRQLAESIISQSGCTGVSIVVLNSMQSITMHEIQSGRTYLGIMRQNLDVLKNALS